MKNFKIVQVGKRYHVVCESVRRETNSMGEKIQEANYMSTRMALCGVLGKKESLDTFIAKYNYKETKR